MFEGGGRERDVWRRERGDGLGKKRGKARKKLKGRGMCEGVDGEVRGCVKEGKR